MFNPDQVDLSTYTGSGVDLVWDPDSRPVAMGWDLIKNRGELDFNQTKAVVDQTLSRDFIEATLATKKGGIPRVNQALVKAAHQGERNGIFEVTAMDDGTQDRFVLVVSSGGQRMNDHTVGDFGRLTDLYNATEGIGIVPICPKVYQLSNGEVSTFSVEELSTHLCLYSTPTMVFSKERPDTHKLFPNDNTHIPSLFTSGDSRHHQFNQAQDLRFKELIDNLERIYEMDALDPIRQKLNLVAISTSSWYKTITTVRASVVSRLYIMNFLIGAVPAEFSLNAGDAMINPDTSPDYQVKLVTISGGWKEIDDKDLQNHLAGIREYVSFKVGGPERLEYPSFDLPSIIYGIILGRRVLANMTADNVSIRIQSR